MAMDFWAAQRRARRTTTLYLITFVIMAFLTAIFAEISFRAMAQDSYETDFPLIAAAFLVITFLVAGFNYLMYRTQGGSYVAKSVGARQVSLQTNDPQERQLVNIIEEVALASHVPIPEIFILEANDINAFAAGLTTDNAAVTVTTGCLQKLTRDELQGVIAHEFGHVTNGDMRISLSIAAMVAGFYFLFILGLRVMQFASFRSSRDQKGNPVLIAAFIFIIAGLLAWFVGSIFRSAVSRQRELLADASSVQYTRQTAGIIGALRKIQKESEQSPSDMPVKGEQYAHMYFENRSWLSALFATHPPLEQRIAALEGEIRS